MQVLFASRTLWLEAPLKAAPLLALALALAPAVAAAEDQPPLLDHSPLREFTQGQPLTLRVTITSPTGRKIFDPKAFVRNAGTETFTPLKLIETSQRGVFQASVPKGLSFESIEYYFEAFDEDGNGPSRIASSKSPLKAKMLEPPPEPDKPAAASGAEVRKAPQVLVLRESEPKAARPLAYVLGGLGLATGGIGGFLGVKALIDSQKEPEHAAQIRATTAFYADICYGATAVLLLGGVVTYFLTEPEKAPASASFNLLPTRGGAAAVVSGRF